LIICLKPVVSDIAIFVLKRDIKFQPTNRLKPEIDYLVVKQKKTKVKTLNAHIMYRYSSVEHMLH